MERIWRGSRKEIENTQWGKKWDGSCTQGINDYCSLPYLVGISPRLSAICWMTNRPSFPRARKNLSLQYMTHSLLHTTLLWVSLCHYPQGSQSMHIIIQKSKGTFVSITLSNWIVTVQEEMKEGWHNRGMLFLREGLSSIDQLTWKGLNSPL